MRIRMRTIFECDECTYRYHSAPWEPKWLSKLVYTEDHKEHHHIYVDAPERHELVEVWRKWERERIIALLEAVDDEVGIFGVGWNMQEIAELIRGESE